MPTTKIFEEKEVKNNEKTHHIGNIIMYIISGVLIIAFVVKGVFVWRDYRHNGGEIQWNVLLVLFICLVVVVSAPSWMWSVIGW